MVKGLTKRVIIVRPPDGQSFEEAIFILKKELGDIGVSGADIVREAEKIAEDFSGRKTSTGIFGKIPAPLYAVIGAALTGAVWAITLIFS